MEQAPAGGFRAWFDVDARRTHLVSGERSHRVRRRGAGTGRGLGPRSLRAQGGRTLRSCAVRSQQGRHRDRARRQRIPGRAPDCAPRRSHDGLAHGAHRSSPGKAGRVTPSARPRSPAASFRPEFLQRFLPWKEGDEYSSAMVLDLQRRLVGADYFGTVTVHAASGKGRGPCRTRSTVELTPAKRNIYSAALYASTDRGAGVELGVQRRWLNDRGHKGRAELDIAQRLQSVELSYRIPLPGTKQRVLDLAGTYRDETTESSVSQTEKFVANVSRKWGGYHCSSMACSFWPATSRSAANAAIPRCCSSKARSRAPSPISLHSRGAATAIPRACAFTPVEALTDTRFVSATIELKWLRALGDGQRLILRGEVGKMKVDDFDQLPPELRFFAGGDRSIRGFGYEEIGSRNEVGDVIGGDNLVEAQRRVRALLGQARAARCSSMRGDAFLGEDFTLHMGVGAGVRWKSPVGVLRLDLAYPSQVDRFEFVADPLQHRAGLLKALRITGIVAGGTAGAAGCARRPGRCTPRAARARCWRCRAAGCRAGLTIGEVRGTVGGTLHVTQFSLSRSRHGHGSHGRVRRTGCRAASRCSRGGCMSSARKSKACGWSCSRRPQPKPASKRGSLGGAARHALRRVAAGAR